MDALSKTILGIAVSGMLYVSGYEWARDAGIIVHRVSFSQGNTVGELPVWHRISVALPSPPSSPTLLQQVVRKLYCPAMHLEQMIWQRLEPSGAAWFTKLTP